MSRRFGRTFEVPAETLPIVDEGDVVVVGGGTSGFIASTAAARTGARTILVERFGYLGGCTTATYNSVISAFSDSDGNQIIGGIPWEFVQRMQRDRQCLVLGYRPQLWPPWTKKVALDMVTEAGVDLYFYTWASDVIKEDGAIGGIIVQSKAGRSVILGKTFVDASGDADVAAYAGAPFEMTDTDNLQQVSCDYTACGVDSAKVVEWVRANKDELRISEKSFEHKEVGAQPMFKVDLRPMLKGYRVGMKPKVRLCIYREAVRIQGNVDTELGHMINPLDPKGLTYAEIEGLRGALKHLEYLRKTMPGFENAFIVAQNHLGVRESRRIIGEYMIKLRDLHTNARFDDVVALNARVLDYHLKGSVFKVERLKGNHDIPLRALLPRDVGNLVVAGRSISCDHLSQASLRGAATCMATGHAAGAAAALAAQNTGMIRDLNIRLLQDTLRNQDVILATGKPEG